MRTGEHERGAGRRVPGFSATARSMYHPTQGLTGCLGHFGFVLSFLMYGVTQHPRSGLGLAARDLRLAGIADARGGQMGLEICGGLRLRHAAFWLRAHSPQLTASSGVKDRAGVPACGRIRRLFR